MTNLILSIVPQYKEQNKSSHSSANCIPVQLFRSGTNVIEGLPCAGLCRVTEGATFSCFLLFLTYMWPSIPALGLWFCLLQGKGELLFHTGCIRCQSWFFFLEHISAFSSYPFILGPCLYFRPLMGKHFFFNTWHLSTPGGLILFTVRSSALLRSLQRNSDWQSFPLDPHLPVVAKRRLFVCPGCPASLAPK